MERIHQIILEQQQHLSALQALAKELEGLYPVAPPQPAPTLVSTTAELLAALEQGGNIELAALEFHNPSGFLVKSNTRLSAPAGATIRADNQPAIRVKPRTTDVLLQGFTCQSGFSGAVIQLGDNSATTQGTADDVPTRITLRDITIPSHRGKRGIEVNAGDVLIEDCTIEDVWATSGQDSQAIGILNSPGRIVIDGGTLSAGSENILLGGDSMKVPGQVIANVVIRNARIYKPLSWKTDGQNRGVKNLLEVKAGKDVQILNCTFDGCWRAGQDGYCFVITPKNSQYIENVTIDGCTVTNVSAGLNILGEDYNTVTPQPTTGVVVRNTSFDVSQAAHGGRGVLALITGGMKTVTFENLTFHGDGNAVITTDSQKVQGPCLVTGSTMTYLKHGVVMPGSMYGTPLPADSPYYTRRLIVTFRNNTFTGAVSSNFKTNFPDNQYPAASRQEQEAIDAE